MLYQMDDMPVIQGFRALVHVAVAVVPGNAVGELVPGVEPHGAALQLACTGLGGGEQPVAEAATLDARRRRDAPQQEIVRARLEDEHTVETFGTLQQPHLVIAQDLCVVGKQRQRFDAEDRAVLGIGGALQRADGVEVSGRCPAEPGKPIHAGAPLSGARLVRWRPAPSKLSDASQRSKAALRAGHSLSSVEYQAVSRLWPLTVVCWREMPSNLKPN